ncbi:MAG: hypothetical protein NVS3B10_04950 [Polyangiales bacterium]
MAHSPAPHDDAHGSSLVSAAAPAIAGDDLPHHGLVHAEPRSPGWLPLVGLALLAGLLVWWLSTPSQAEEDAAAAAASASASAAIAPAPSAPPAPTPAAIPAPRPTITAVPAPPPGGGIPPGALTVAPAAQINPKFKK